MLVAGIYQEITPVHGECRRTEQKFTPLLFSGCPGGLHENHKSGVAMLFTRPERVN
jgi:hypothetical protein